MSAKQKALGRTLEFYKNLPMELRTLALIAGIFVPTMAVGSIFYFVQDITGIRNKWVSMAILVGVILLITAIVFLVNGVSKWRGRSKAKRIAKDMLGEEAATARPTSMSQREAIKGNNEKFEKAVAEMKQTYGVSVYTLPWYIVIGESGCGKTRLINESNLEFPSGKPEGHTIGTLNYNWWFTQDMVFLDMAGRLVNPAEDKDHAEWLGVLRTIRKGRQRCPLNGALVCISADEDLLNVTPEKLRANADNMLLRLRELQRELGVTFPVYLIVTKCDKLLGFMDFFGRVTGKLALSTQMVGWSREGEEFNAAYDPDNFKKSFEDLYQRVHQFRLRRLRDDIDPQVRSAAYCYPEEFAQLRDPLLVYINTLFPYLKNQLVVKNLIFRGVFFTSATQQSEAVLGHLRNKLGDDAAKAMARLSVLYSQPEPRFVKELLQKKVEPENGLVYRNEAQLQRNRKAARWLQLGTVALALLAGAGFWWSYRAFTDVVKDPRQHSRETHREDAQRFVDNAALVRTGELAKDSDAMDDPRTRWLARILSMGLGTDAPRDYLNATRHGFLHERVFPLAAARIATGVETFDVTDDPNAQETYLQALVGLVKWWRASPVERCIPECVQLADLQAMANVSTAPGDGQTLVSLWNWKVAEGVQYVLTGTEEKKSSRTEASFESTMRRYFGEVDGRRGQVRNPAIAFRDKEAALQLGVKRLAEKRLPWAQLARADEDLGDSNLNTLIRLARDCRAAQNAYDQFLKSCANPEVPNADVYAALIQQVKSTALAFNQAMQKLPRDGIGSDEHLWKLLCEYRNRNWGEFHNRLRNATCSPCGGSDRALMPAVPDDLEKLDAVFWNALRDHGLVGRDEPLPDSGFAADRPAPVSFLGFTKAFAHMVRVDAGTKRALLTEEATTVDQNVQRFANSLEAAEANRGSLFDWARAIVKHTQSAQSISLDLASVKSAAWSPDRLETIGSRFAPLLHKGRGTALLVSLADTIKACQEANSAWALAAWQTREWNSPVSSAYAMAIPATLDKAIGAAASAPQTETRDPAELTAELGGTTRSRSAARHEKIPRCCTRAVLTSTAVAVAQLCSALERLQPDKDFLPTAATSPQDAQAQLQHLWTQYSDKYAKTWASAVSERPLPSAPTAWAQVVQFAEGDKHQEVCALAGDFSEHVAFARFLNPQTEGAAGSGWLRDAKIGREAGAAARIDDELVAALDAAFPQLKTPNLSEEEQKSPWTAEEVRLVGAWEALRKDVRAADQVVKNIESATDAPQPDRFHRIAEAEAAASWPALSAMDFSVKYEKSACELLASELRREFESRKRSAAGKPRREGCAELKRLKDLAGVLSRGMGRCAETLLQIAPEPGICCDDRADSDLDAVTVSFEVVPEGIVDRATGQPFQKGREQLMSTCCSKVELRIGGNPVEFSPQDPPKSGKLTLREVSGLQVAMKNPATLNPVVLPPAQSRAFSGPRDFLSFLKQGRKQGNSYTTTETIRTKVEKTGEPVFIRQAITWTLSGRVAGVSVEEFLEKCGG